MELKIKQIDRALPDGMVLSVHWTATKTENDYTASVYGSVVLPAKEPSDPTFVDYEDLTQEQVIEWVKEAIGEEKMASLEDNMATQIEAQKTPKTASGLPW